MYLNGFAGDDMFESLKESWKLIREAPPGKRFRRQYRRRQASRKSIAGKIVLIGLGVIIVVVGVVMLPAPGPGTLVVFLGLGLIAQESLYLSVLLDKFEVWLRKTLNILLSIWKKTPVWAKVAVALLALVITAFLAYGAYLTLMS